MKEPIIYQEDIFFKDKGIKVSVFIDFLNDKYGAVSNIRSLANNNADIVIATNDDTISVQLLEVIHYDFQNLGKSNVVYKLRIKHVHFVGKGEKRSRKIIRVLSENLPPETITIKELATLVCSLTIF